MLNKKRSKKLLLLIAGTAIFFYYIHNRQAEQDASVQAQELEAAKAVTVLPPGTEEAWDAYVDRRVASLLQRRGNSVRLNDLMSKMMSTITIVSVTSPYEITCGITGSSIDFPQTATKFGDEVAILTLDIYIISQNSEPAQQKSESKKLAYINLDSSGEQPPPLGVDIKSTAAEELREHLCQRITDDVQTIFTLQISMDGGAK